MSLTKDQQEAAARLLFAYPAALGFSPDKREAIDTFDSLVELGHADVVEDPQLPAGRSYRLSDEAAEAHRQLIERRAAEAGLN